MRLSKRLHQADVKLQPQAGMVHKPQVQFGLHNTAEVCNVNMMLSTDQQEGVTACGLLPPVEHCYSHPLEPLSESSF